MDFIDFRSDTFTIPTKEMLSAMMKARVGDDVFEEDFETNELEQFAANMFGMEAAIFCPSGTMTNQIAVKIHTQPGDEVICSELSHVYQYEAGGMAFNSGCSQKLIYGNRGLFTERDILNSINPDDVHKAISKLVVVENTCNKGGGAVWDFEELVKIQQVCKDKKLKFHLDGARLFNALVVSGGTPKDYGGLFDSISICLSKGLGAPIGSLLLGTKYDIRKARRIRKIFGGGMRQSGYIAAAGRYALENNIERLKIDNDHAKYLAKSIANLSFVEKLYPIDTNIIIFELNDTVDPDSFIKSFEKKGIKIVSMGGQLIRFVTHLGITEEMILKTERILKDWNK